MNNEHELSDDYFYSMINHHYYYFCREGYSVLLYGLGSKRHVIQTLHQEVLQDCNVLLVNGFFPGVLIKNVCEKLLTLPMDCLQHF